MSRLIFDASTLGGTTTLSSVDAVGNFTIDVPAATGPLLIPTSVGTAGQALISSGTAVPIWQTAGTGTVTSVSFTGGLISVATPTSTPALTVAGTSGGVPYFTSASTWASSAVLAANALMIGGGAAATPATTATGTGVLTALGTNIGTAGSFVLNGGVLGTPSSGTVTNLTGTASININGTVGATTPATVVATQVDITAQGDLRLQDTTGGEYVALQAPATLAASYTLTLPVDDGTSGQALVTDGNGVLSWSTAASGDVYGPASATDNAIARFDLTTGKIIQNSVVTIADTTGNMAGVGTLSSGAITSSSLTSGRVPYAGTAGLIQDAAALTFDGTILSATRFAGALNGTVGATTPSTGAFTTLSGTGQLTLTNASNYNLYASGAGANYFAGNVGIGTTTPRVPLAFAATVGTAGVPTKIRLFDDGASNFYGFGVSSGSLDIAGGTGGAVTLYANGATERLRVASTGVISLGAAVGSESLRVTPVASAVNYWNAAGAVTGANPYLQASGSDTNIGFTYTTKGSGSHFFQTNNFASIQFLIAHTASAVNYFQVTGAATADAPALSAQGTDTNINLTLTPKGTGGVGVGTPSPTTKFEAFATANSLQIISSVRNDQAGSGIAAIGFNVSSSASGDTSANKAGIGLERQNVQGVGQINFYNRGTTDTSSFTASDIRGTIGQTGIWSLGAAAGSESLRVTPVASAVNYWNFNGNTAGNSPFLLLNGSDTNIPALLLTKGTGNFGFYTGTTSGLTGAVQQFNIAHTASAVNYISAYGAPTGSGGYFQAAGSDTNIPLVYSSKGNREHAFYTAGNSFTQQFQVSHTASAVNYLQVTGAATANFPQIQMAGSDTNVGLNLSSKGTGTFGFYGQSFSTTQFAIGNTASAVNYLQATGAATTGGPALYAQGSDTNISIAHVAKGLGGNYFQSANGNQFSVDATSSAVNWISATGSPTGSAPSLTVTGSDTNIDFKLITKGTGVLLFGTYTAGVVVQAGYITIKDAGGTTRRLLVG